MKLFSVVVAESAEGWSNQVQSLLNKGWKRAPDGFRVVAYPGTDEDGLPGTIFRLFQAMEREEKA